MPKSDKKYVQMFHLVYFLKYCNKIENNDYCISRMFSAVKWLAGFTLIQLMKTQISNVASQESDCAVTKTNADQLYADCSDRKHESIRRGLGDALEILNISNNPFNALNEGDLNEYAHLKELIMRHLKVHSTSENFLIPLTALNVLDISNTSLVDKPKLPPSITTMVANNLQESVITLVTQGRYDFQVLTNLYEIYLDDNSYTTLPPLNIKAPITIICMRGNPFEDLDYGDLAHFCQLKYLGLDTFRSGEKYADKCCYVRLWVDEYDITSKLKCEKECEKHKYPLNATAVETHQECIKQVEIAQELLYDSYGLILTIGVAVFLLCIIGFVVFKFARSSDSQEHDEDTPKSLEKELETDEPAQTSDDKDEASVGDEENAENQ